MDDTPIKRAAQRDIHDIHHLEIFVENHLQAAFFYRAVLGFRVLGTWKSVTGEIDRSSIVLAAGDIRLVLTAPAHANSPVAEHIRRHGESIRDIALSVSDVDKVFQTAVANGATPMRHPVDAEDSSGVVRSARIGAMGSLVHSLIDARKYAGCFLPEYDRAKENAPSVDSALALIDHVALALGPGELDRWTEFYIRTLGFRETHQEQVSTDYSAMRSKVVQSESGGVRFPMMEPATGRRKSQIESFVAANEGPGAQHIAFLSTDILNSVAVMRRGGVEFLATPETYYDILESRVGHLPVSLQALRESGILADRDGAGVLLQIFTKPIGARPTLFLELVQRYGAEGFGSGNIRALFEAVERAQTVSAGA